jgi:hypothetical protein
VWGIFAVDVLASCSAVSMSEAGDPVGSYERRYSVENSPGGDEEVRVGGVDCADEGDPVSRRG